MPLIVRDLPALKTVSTSGGANFSQGIGGIDDASSLSLFLTSSFTGNSSAAVIQVSQFDPNLATSASGELGTVQSSNWYNLSTAIATVTSSASQIFINQISFRGIRLSYTSSSSQKGEIVAFASKQITV
jgi:hypothetical protein